MNWQLPSQSKSEPNQSSAKPCTPQGPLGSRPGEIARQRLASRPGHLQRCDPETATKKLKLRIRSKNRLVDINLPFLPKWKCACRHLQRIRPVLSPKRRGRLSPVHRSKCLKKISASSWKSWRDRRKRSQISATASQGLHGGCKHLPHKQIAMLQIRQTGM